MIMSLYLRSTSRNNGRLSTCLQLGGAEEKCHDPCRCTCGVGHIGRGVGGRARAYSWAVPDQPLLPPHIRSTRAMSPPPPAATTNCCHHHPPTPQPSSCYPAAPAQHAGDVLGQLALAQLDVVGAQIDGVAAQLEEALQQLRTRTANSQLLFDIGTMAWQPSLKKPYGGGAYRRQTVSTLTAPLQAQNTHTGTHAAQQRVCVHPTHSPSQMTHGCAWRAW